jgi:hypothetical protein
MRLHTPSVRSAPIAAELAALGGFARFATVSAAAAAAAFATGAMMLVDATPVAAQDVPACHVANDVEGRASPLDSVSVELMGATAKVCYGRPSANDREVMGGLVPFGEPWRTGANEATALHLTFPAEVAGIRVEPGSYAIYTVPGETQWEVVLAINYARWGIPIPGDDVIGRATVSAESTDAHVETLTFGVDLVSEMETHLVLEWERTRIRIPVRHAHRPH